MARLDNSIASLLEQFVCVRVVQMNGVDVSRFQFDGDQTWAGFFLHSDGTILGRYGTRHGGKSEAEERVAVASLRAALGRALELHQDYDARREEVTDKQGEPFPWRRVDDMPALQGTTAGVVQSGQCIHCHHVPTTLRRSLWMEGKPTPERWLWPFPPPESVGLTLSRDDGVLVQTVTPGSPAETSGLQAGDRLVSMNGQGLLSAADVEWVLHNLPREAEVETTVQRGTETVTTRFTVSGSWRESDLSWRESSWQLRPGLWLEELSDESRSALSLANDALGLHVKWVLPKGTAKGVFKEGDVVVAVAGNTERRDESQLMVWMRNEFAYGAEVTVRVMRDGSPLELELSLK